MGRDCVQSPNGSADKSAQEGVSEEQRAGIVTKDTRQRGERGFSLMMLSLLMFVMLGMVGLAIDLGRMYIYKTELQTFADASALAAVAQLDGTQTGVQLANAVATAGPIGTTKPNGYAFDTTVISDVAASYSTSFAGTYNSYETANSPGANTYRFIRVTASVSAPLSFLPVLPGIPTQMALSASATAGQKPQSTMSRGGLLPFVPDAHNQADTKNFGLTPGAAYTLKWGNGNTTTCPGDAGFTPPGSPPSEHGFVDIGEGDSNNNVRLAIEYGGYPNATSTPSSVQAGDTLSSVPGNRGTSIFDALQNRASQDTDDVSSTYAAYLSGGTGNGRRIVTVAIGGTWSGHGSNASTPVLGFANFFLNTAYSGTSGPICATYIGPGDPNGHGSGGSDGTVVYTNVLYQ
jgi:Flp pilus assembly protein TadG